jgi:hypothetical protein
VKQDLFPSCGRKFPGLMAPHEVLLSLSLSGSIDRNYPFVEGNRVRNFASDEGYRSSFQNVVFDKPLDDRKYCNAPSAAVLRYICGTVVLSGVGPETAY